MQSKHQSGSWHTVSVQLICVGYMTEIRFQNCLSSMNPCGELTLSLSKLGIVSAIQKHQRNHRYTTALPILDTEESIGSTMGHPQGIRK